MGSTPPGTPPRTVEGLDRNATVIKHLSKVRFLANRMASRLPSDASLTAGDLLSHGSIGLLEAFDHFDPRYGIKFSTFAEHRIRGAMLDALREADPLGRRQRSLARQAERAQAELANRTGQRPSAGAVAEQLGLRLEQYFRVQQSLAAVRKMSLEDRDLADGTAEGVGGSAPRHHTSGLEVMAGLAREDTSELIARALTNLPDRQRTIVELVYLKGMQGKDIATLMNLSKARVSQLLTKARHQLRRAIERESKEQGLSWRETVGTPTR